MAICVRKANYQRYKTKYVTSRNYSRYHHSDMQNKLKNKDFSLVLNSCNVNTAVENLTTILNEIFDEYAPVTKKRLSGKPTPWLNIGIKQHMDRRDKLLRKARKSNSGHDWKLYKKLKTFCNNALRKSKRNYYRGLLNENRLNSSVSGNR